jgi:hypothetical protein
LNYGLHFHQNAPSPLCLHDKPNYALHFHWNTFCPLCSCQNLSTYGLYSHQSPHGMLCLAYCWLWFTLFVKCT